MGQIISLKYDFSFKYLFLNEAVRRHFISDVLRIPLEEIRDKRSLFYLSKLFTEDLLSGQKYQKLKRCICISVLGFNLDERLEHHKVYRLRDETGHEFSDMLDFMSLS